MKNITGQKSLPFLARALNEIPCIQRNANVLVTVVGALNLVHMDNPDALTIKQRIRYVLDDAMNDDAFEQTCSLCQILLNEPQCIVFMG